MISNMLSFPLWACDPLPLDTILTETIDREFYQPATAFDDIARGQRLHAQVIEGPQNNNLNLGEYERVLAEFYYFVDDLSAKLPNHVATFIWHNTLYHHSASVETRDWKSEQHILVFQTGILHVLAAHTQNVHSEDGLKKACTSFQFAAGCFQHCLDAYPGLEGQDEQTTQCLRAIAVGQAQELVWQKAVRGMAMKHTAIARLAAKVADFYEEAVEWGQKSGYIRQECLNHLQVKQYHFRAAASFRMAAHALDTFEYGTQVAFLKQALLQCIEASRHKRYVAQNVVDDLAGLHTAVSETLVTAEKDNDLVYLNPVPELQELRKIIGVAMAEPKKPKFLVEREAAFTPALTSLMPFAVVQVSQAFRERQDTYIASAFHEPLSALTRMLRQFLTDRELPAILDAAQIPEGLPNSIVSHAQEILASGGTQFIDRTMAELATQAENSRGLVAECEHRLKLEKHEDDLMREREGTSRWTRVPSHTANSSHWATVDKMLEYLEQGAQSDAALAESYRKIRNSLTVYCGGQQALLSYIPKHAELSLGKGETLAARLRELLDEVASLETKRDRFRSSIDLKSRNHSILSVVVDAYKRNPSRFEDENGMVIAKTFEPVYEKHIAFFDPDLDYVSQSKDMQSKLEQQILETNEQFRQVRELSLSKAHEQRLAVLQSLETDYVKYLELVQNMAEAARFYASFLDRGNAVLAQIVEFLRNRREEARELAQTINAQLDFEAIEQSMSPTQNLAAPRSQKPNHSLWDPSKGIKFS